MIAVREFMLPSDHPVLPGHFPDDPVVPGVVLLAWCEQMAAELAAAPITVSAWTNVKFIRPLKPMQPCNVALNSSIPGSAAFRIEFGDHLIASGNLTWQSATG